MLLYKLYKNAASFQTFLKIITSILSATVISKPLSRATIYMNTSQSKKYSVTKVLTLKQKMLHVHRNGFLSIFNFNNADNC